MSTENLAPASLGHAACITSGGVAASLSRMASLSLGPSVALKAQSASAAPKRPRCRSPENSGERCRCRQEGKKVEGRNNGHTDFAAPPTLLEIVDVALQTFRNPEPTALLTLSSPRVQGKLARMMTFTQDSLSCCHGKPQLDAATKTSFPVPSSQFSRTPTPRSSTAWLNETEPPLPRSMGAKSTSADRWPAPRTTTTSWPGFTGAEIHDDLFFVPIKFVQSGTW